MTDGQIKQMSIKNYSSIASNNAPEVSIVFILNFVVNQEKLVMWVAKIIFTSEGWNEDQ